MFLRATTRKVCMHDYIRLSVWADMCMHISYVQVLTHRTPCMCSCYVQHRTEAMYFICFCLIMSDGMCHVHPAHPPLQPHCHTHTTSHVFPKPLAFLYFLSFSIGNVLRSFSHIKLAIPYYENILIQLKGKPQDAG